MGYPYGGPGPQLPPPAFGRPEPIPNSGTAIAAAAISLIVGLLLAFGTLSAGMFAVTEVDRQYRSGELYFVVASSGVAALVWLSAAALLFLRTTAGRVLVIVASVLSLIFTIAQAVDTVEPLALMLMFPPLAPLILAAVPSTGRWIAAESTSRPGPVRRP
ncbi:hypothetical protein [Nocardia sp. NPDC049526]|uniref:hypothetical protein n=1 Tax=Nocardia sp. NPDC049526 TaxID=3364316 RepID=UPI0037A6BF8C